jgi:hypothetical protein
MADVAPLATFGRPVRLHVPRFAASHTNWLRARRHHRSPKSASCSGNGSPSIIAVPGQGRRGVSQGPRAVCRQTYNDVMVDSPEARRFAQAVRMADQGIELMRQNFRRRHPEETDQQIDGRLEDWLADRPLDAPGQVVAGS